MSAELGIVGSDAVRMNYRRCGQTESKWWKRHRGEMKRMIRARKGDVSEWYEGELERWAGGQRRRRRKSPA